MGRVGNNAALRELERALDPAQRYVDLAVRLRVLNEDGSPGRLLPQVLGGRWDTWALRWVSPRPADLQVHEWTIQEQQIPLLLETPGDVQFVALFAGRQAGKSRVGVMDVALDWIRSPGRRFGIVSLNFKSSRDPEEALKALLAPWWRVEHNKTDRTYSLPTGATIVFRSEEAIESLRGPSLKKILLDEAAYMAESAFTTAVGCGAAAQGFRILLATTPKRENPWIRQVDVDWGAVPVDAAGRVLRSKSGGARVYRLRTEENPRRNRKLLDELRESMPADVYAQEFEGKMVPPQDLVYCVFDRRKNVRELPDLGDYTKEFTRREFGVAAPYLIGWDFGVEAALISKVYRGPQTIVTDDGPRIVQVETLWAIDELVSERTTTENHALHVIERWGRNAVVVTDAIGAHANASGRGLAPAAVRILQEAGFAHVTVHGPGNPDVGVRVRTVNRLIDSPKFGARFFVRKDRCRQLVSVLENQRMGPGGKPIKDGTEHIVDAFGYLCLRAFPIRSEMPAGFTGARRAGGEDE